VGVLDNTRDSRQSLVFDLAFLGVDAQGRDVEVALRADQFLQSINIQLKEAAWTGTVVLFDRQGDALDALLFAAGDRRRVRVSWGWEKAGVDIGQYPKFLGVITKPLPQFTPQGVTLTLELSGVKAAQQYRDRKIRSFAAGTFISSNDPGDPGVFQQIAAARGWNYDENTVEDSSDKLTESATTNGESDVEFLLRLATQTKGKNGKHFLFLVEDRDGRTHFRTFDHRVDQRGVRASDRRAVRARYVFARGVDGDVINFAPSDESFFKTLFGGGNTEFVGFNSLDGTALKITTSQTEGVPGIPLTTLGDAVAVPSFEGTALYRINIQARDAAEFQRRVVALHDRMREFTYKAELEVRGTHAIRQYDYIRVEYLRENGDLHYLSGTFRVMEVEHDVSTGGWTTRCLIVREGANPQPGSTQLQPTETIVPTEEQAQGVNQESVGRHERIERGIE